MRNGSKYLGSRKVGDFNHAARIPSLLKLAVLFKRRFKEGLSIKVVGRNIADTVILSCVAGKLIHHAAGARTVT